MNGFIKRYLLFLLFGVVAGACQVMASPVWDPSGNLVRPIFKNVSVPPSAYTVMGICQDRKGMMWLATGDGLYSYDGYSLHLHPLDGIKGRLGLRAVSLIDDHYLCLGSLSRGVLVFNLRTGRWEDPFPELHSIHSVTMLKVYGGYLWIGTNVSGVYAFHLRTRKLRKCKLPKSFPDITAFEGAGNSVYFSSVAGLCSVDLATWKVTLVLVPGNNPFVNTLFWDHQARRLLVGMENYVYSYDPRLHQMRPLLLQPGNVFKSIQKDLHGNLFFGTDAGLILYDPRTHQAEHFLHDTKDARSIGSNIVWQIITDREGNLWMATEKGVSLLQRNLPYQLVPLYDLTGSGEGNTITQMLYDSKGRLWMGGDNGIILYDGRETIWFNANNPSHHLAHNRIRRIVENKDHDIWLASDGSIARFDETTRQFVYYHVVTPDGRHADWCYGVQEDERGRLWLNTWASGLLLVNKKQLMANGPHRPFVARPLKGFDYQDSRKLVQDVIMDGHGSAWVSSANCITKVDLQTLGQRRYPIANSFLSLCNGSLFIGQGNQVLKMEIPSGHLSRVYQLNRGSLTAFVPDGKKLWILTTEGMDCLSTDDGKVRNTDLPVGYYPSGCVDTRLKRLVLGGEDCLLTYRLSKRGIPERRVYVSSVIEGDDTSGSPSHVVMLLDTNQIHLKNGGNVTLELSTFYYSPVNDRIFYYRFEDEKEWHQLAPGRNQISFAGMNAGHYRLCLSAANPTVNPHALVQVYDIYVPRPWYSSYPMQCLYLLMIVLFIIGLFRYQQRRAKRRLELREKEKTLELSQQKMDFFVNISHELKTPLTLIIAPLSKLIETSTQEKQKRVLTLIYENAMKLNALIGKVLNFKQLEYDGASTLLRSYIELNHLIRNSIHYFQQVSDDRHLRIEYRSDEKEVWIHADAQKLESVFTNLIANAVKYVKDDTGKVEIDLHVHDQKVVIDVMDNGPGIPEEDQKMIFIRFFQGKNAKQKKGGTGIGLYLVKEFVTLHGGTVQVSGRNPGTTFTVILPLDGDNAVDRGSREEDEQPVSPEDTRQKIAIIDDNHEIVDLLAENLQDTYLCLKAYDGKEGLKLIQEQLPDLIIVDQMMPEMNGFEMCRELKRNQPTATIPIIMLTAKDDMLTEEESIKVGINVFIPKPFDLRKVHLQIVRLLAQHRDLEKSIQISRITHPEFKPVERQASPDENIIRDITKIIEDNMDSEELNVATLAEKSGMEQKQLYRKVKQLTGCSPIAYIKKLRMKKAAVLLKEKQFTVSEVMYMVGYTNASYFTRCFSEEFGMTPKQYRDQSDR